jgi:hypothetical protein
MCVDYASMWTTSSMLPMLLLWPGLCCHYAALWLLLWPGLCGAHHIEACFYGLNYAIAYTCFYDTS